MDEHTGHYAKWVQQTKTNTAWFYLYIKSKKQMNKHNKTETVSDTENKQVVARGKGCGEMREIGDGD